MAEYQFLKNLRIEMSSDSNGVEVTHPSFPQPENRDAKIWRYMDLSKFASMLLAGALFFPRATKLGDPFEGSNSKMVEAWRNSVRANRSATPEEDFFGGLSLQQVNEMFESEQRFLKESVPTFFVNCWHQNEYESAAMWKLYAKSDEAVCVQSTYRKLLRVLPKCVDTGLVTYRDYDQDGIDPGNVFNFIMSKRKSFEHEKEIRAVAWEKLSGELGGDEIRGAMNEFGLSIQVDMLELVENVFVSPTSPAWFKEVVQGLSRKLGLKLNVQQSKISEVPIF